jgi:hypothetical protein
MRLIGVSTCCLALAASAIPRAYSPKFHCDASESANAVYHLACLAGNIPCTKPVFERFWRDKLQLKAADQSEFDAWTAIMTKVANAAPPPKPAPYIGNTARSILMLMRNTRSSGRPWSQDHFPIFSVARAHG